MYLAGGEHWETWWPAIRDELIESQNSATALGPIATPALRLWHRHGDDHPPDAQTLPPHLPEMIRAVHDPIPTLHPARPQLPRRLSCGAARSSTAQDTRPADTEEAERRVLIDRDLNAREITLHLPHR